MAYLDHAATTPMLPEAIEAMTAQLSVTGNASSLHAAGRRARRTVEESRETLADSLGARPSEVVFTAGGTQADNLAVKASTGPAATPTPAAPASSPARSSTTPSWTPSTGWPTARARRSSTSRSTGTAGFTRRICARRSCATPTTSR
ncbi:Cysteine desulfurase IscS [Streptomyces californicus]